MWILQYIEIPELSLSPRRMLGPFRISFLSYVSLLAFLMDALDTSTHCTLSIDQPFKAKSLAPTSLQPFRLVSSMLQCNTRACSPTRGIYHSDIMEDIVCRRNWILELCIGTVFWHISVNNCSIKKGKFCRNTSWDVTTRVNISTNVSFITICFLSKQWYWKEEKKIGDGSLNYYTTRDFLKTPIYNIYYFALFAFIRNFNNISLH